MHPTSCSSWIAYTWKKTCEKAREFIFQFIFSLLYMNCFSDFIDFSYCRDDVVMKTAIGVLGDLTDTLGSTVGSLIQQSLSSKEFLNECLTSDDRLIKESAEWAKLAINRVISV